jgi:hypothetical protein
MFAGHATVESGAKKPSIVVIFIVLLLRAGVT